MPIAPERVGVPAPSNLHPIWLNWLDGTDQFGVTAAGFCVIAITGHRRQHDHAENRPGLLYTCRPCMKGEASDLVGGSFYLLPRNAVNARRPHAKRSIVELEKLVAAPSANPAVKRAVLAELDHRNTMRAAILRRRLTVEIGKTGSGEAKSPLREEIAWSGTALGSSQPPETLSPATPVALPVPPTVPRSASAEAKRPPIDAIPPASTGPNDPFAILQAWTVLEVLSPATFKRPGDLAGGDLRRIARLERGLPWEDGPAKGPPGKRLYFQIVLGSLPMQTALDQLLERFGDGRPERPQARGETPLAIVIVDREGRPIADRCAVISSFGWGFPRAVRDDPATLGTWAQQGTKIEAELHELLFREGKDGKTTPLNLAAIHNAHTWLVNSFGLDPAMVLPPAFMVRSVVPMRQNDPPEPLLLNSFYLEDLAKAEALLREGKAPDTLKRFLGMIAPAERRDLLLDKAAIEATLAPARFPVGRWPGPGRHPLVLMQQAAVNLALEQSPGEILAVNGPPGTGKTTLLRDVIAGLVTKRAAAMAAFNDPEKAFTNSGERLNLGGGWIHLYKLEPGLKGYEMLIASSNNKAVENVSRELPALGAIAEDAAALRYFKPMADTLLDGESWGAIAAVLGNGKNRAEFKDRFWWDEDTGLFPYFKALDGRCPEIEEEGRKRPPRIVSELDPPLDRRRALARWATARQRFLDLQKEVNETRQTLERLRLRNRLLPELENAFQSVKEHGGRRPGLWSRLFGLRSWQRWRDEHRPKSDRFATAAGRAADAKLFSKGDAALRVSRSPWLGFNADKHGDAFEAGLRSYLDTLARDLQARAAPLIDDDFFAQGDDIQRASPWFSREEHRQRDALFIAAVDLHRAFIDAAAKPLRHNIGAALQILDGRGFADADKDCLIPDLWSSLFLVIPAISTTFASVHAMLGQLPPASLGWLLVDEAGQASPQQAVGAILRAKHAIIVGDPIQVPPVVLLPERLTAAICASFAVDSTRFAAPAASVQTLADDATPWFAEFGSGAGSRTVGVPLLVHRRCSAPMFEIANRVAYEGLMVQAKTLGKSPIRDLLGPSRWLHVSGAGSDKWCPEEGHLVIELLERILAAGLALDLYIVTPFVQVADGLRRIVRESTALASAIPDIDRWVFERVGTIHTVQGREAEAVIFVLGASNADQRGARSWAGREPNLLNVAVTRAKEALYVIGNRDLWRMAGVFGNLDREIGNVDQNNTRQVSAPMSG